MFFLTGVETTETFKPSYIWVRVEEQLSTPLLFLLKAHRFPLIFPLFPFVLASTVTFLPPLSGLSSKTKQRYLFLMVL